MDDFALLWDRIFFVAVDMVAGWLVGMFEVLDTRRLFEFYIWYNHCRYALVDHDEQRSPSLLLQRVVAYLCRKMSIESSKWR